MATASSSASTSPPRIKVKKEICSDNDAIKELAETAMNDILGWYGYDSVDRLELAANNVLPSSASTSIPVHDEEGPAVRRKSDNENNNSMLTRTPLPSGSPSPLSSTNPQHKTKSSTSSKHNHHQLQPSGIGGHFLSRQQHDDPLVNPLPSTSSIGGERRGQRDTSARPGLSGSPPPATTCTTSTTTRNGIVLHHQAHHQQQLQHHHVAAGGGGAGESSTSEKDSSRESSKSPMLMKMLTDKQEQTCQWCRKVIPSHQTGILGTTEGMIFCTEACFSQSRRASFKRAKTCDWCRHVRHAVSYVDFQDGASQLQFCSDKCLNQYKMQIFCNETQAHLEMNPHLKEKSTSAGSLITPELWMKNCKSCSISPVSERSESVSPAPSLPVRSSPEPSPVLLRSPTPAKKPLISVAPASKLLSKSLQQSALSRSNPKSSRKRRAGHRPQAGTNASLPKRSTSTQQVDYGVPVNSGSGTSINNNNVTIPNNNLAGSPSTVITTGQGKSAPNAQDLRILQKKHGSVVNLTSNEGPPMVGFDGRDIAGSGGSLGPPPPPPPPLNIPPQFLPPPLNLMRAPFFPLNPAQLRFASGLPNLTNAQPPPPPPPPMGPPPSPLPPGVPLGPGGRPPVPNMLGFGATPPVTILVPYPIIIPLPLPIPVPIPVIDFLKAALPKDKSEKAAEKPSEQKGTLSKDDQGTTVMLVDSDETMCDDTPPVDALLEDDSDVPLDFTVSGQGKEPGRAVTPAKARKDVWNEAEQMLPVESSPVGGAASPTYALSTIAASEPDPVPSGGEDQQKECEESAKRLLPKFKITRLEVGKVHEAVRQVDDGVGERTKEETEMEREHKEMVERSRPLRKRKRLVVQQHLQTEPDPPERSNEEGVREDQEYRSGIELRSGNKGK